MSIWEKFVEDIESCSEKVGAVSDSLRDIRWSPRFDEAYKVDRDPKITAEFLNGLKERVQSLYDYAFNTRSPLQ